MRWLGVERGLLGAEVFFALVEFGFAFYEGLAFFAEEVFAAFEEFFAFAEGGFGFFDRFLASLDFGGLAEEGVEIADLLFAAADFFFAALEGGGGVAEAFRLLVERRFHLLKGGSGFGGKGGGIDGESLFAGLEQGFAGGEEGFEFAEVSFAFGKGAVEFAVLALLFFQFDFGGGERGFAIEDGGGFAHFRGIREISDVDGGGVVAGVLADDQFQLGLGGRFRERAQQVGRGRGFDFRFGGAGLTGGFGQGAPFFGVNFGNAGDHGVRSWRLATELAGGAEEFGKPAEKGSDFGFRFGNRSGGSEMAENQGDCGLLGFRVAGDDEEAFEGFFLGREFAQVFRFLREPGEQAGELGEEGFEGGFGGDGSLSFGGGNECGASVFREDFDEEADRFGELEAAGAGADGEKRGERFQVGVGEAVEQLADFAGNDEVLGHALEERDGVANGFGTFGFAESAGFLGERGEFHWESGGNGNAAEKLDGAFVALGGGRARLDHVLKRIVEGGGFLEDIEEGLEARGLAFETGGFGEFLEGIFEIAGGGFLFIFDWPGGADALGEFVEMHVDEDRTHEMSAQFAPVFGGAIEKGTGGKNFVHKSGLAGGVKRTRGGRGRDLADDFVGEVQVILDDVLVAGLLADENYRQTEGDGAANDDGVANDGVENPGGAGDAFLVAELVETELHPHFRHFDIDVGFYRVEKDALDFGRRSHAGAAETGGEFLELHQFVDEQGETDEAEGVGIGRDVDFVAAEKRAAGGFQDVRRAIEEDEIVVVFDFGELLLEEDVGGAGGVGLEFVFEVDQVEGGRDEIERREEFVAVAVFEDGALDDVFEPDGSGIENGEDGSVGPVVEDIPAFEPHHPDAGVGLGVEVDEENAVSLVRQTTGEVDDDRCLADSSLVINETDFARHDFFGWTLLSRPVFRGEAHFWSGGGRRVTNGWKSPVISGLNRS